MRSRRPAVARRRKVQSDNEVFRSEGSWFSRTRVSANGHAWNYTVVSIDAVYDVERWSSAEEALVRCVYDDLNSYVVRRSKWCMSSDF